MKQSFKVKQKERGVRLLPFLREHYPRAPSVKALKRWIEGKRCRVNGRVETFSTAILKEGDVVELEPGEVARLRPIVLWEDDQIVAYDKPAGVVSVPEMFKGKLIHRLDKETSGVLLVAKNRLILDAMIDLFKGRKIEKQYVALVDGVIRQERGTFVSKLAPRHRYQGQTLYGSSPSGQEAITEWEVVARGDKSSLVLCRPLTGRTHQLRVQLKEAGHPIIGDYQYARVFHAPFQAVRHLLHAYQIAFRHPVTGEEVKVTAPLPIDFLEALDSLGMTHASELFYKEQQRESRNPRHQHKNLKKR